MIRRIWTAYSVEMAKALGRRTTYIGPVLVALAVFSPLLADPIAKDGVSDYSFIACATGVAQNLLGLLLVLTFSAGLISSELASGTIRLTLVRPVRRAEYYVAKLLLGMTYAAALGLVVAVVAWGTAFSLGELRGITSGGEIVFTGTRMALTYAAGLVLSLLPQFAAVSFALMISSLTRSTGAAIGVTIGLWLLVDIVKSPLGIAAYLFSSYMQTPWAVFAYQCDNIPSSWSPGAYYCVGTSLAAMAVFITVGIAALHRRDLQA